MRRKSQMKKEERKVILIGVVIVVAVLGIVLVVNAMGKKGDNANQNVQNTQVSQNTEKYVTNLDDGTKLNNSSELNKSKKYKDIEIDNIQFTYENGRTVLLASVKNTASAEHKNEIVKLTILGENSQVIDEVEAIMPALEPGETKQLNATISGKDSVNAKDFRIEAKK